MPDPEPNPKMDELLKALAQKRREQAGAPMELHPATRAMLQAEVARQFPKREAAKRAGIPFLRKLFLSGAAVAAVVICAVSFYKAEQPVPEPEMASVNKPVLLKVAQLPAPGPALAENSLAGKSDFASTAKEGLSAPVQLQLDASKLASNTATRAAGTPPPNEQMPPGAADLARSNSIASQSDLPSGAAAPSGALAMDKAGDAKALSTPVQLQLDAGKLASNAATQTGMPPSSNEKSPAADASQVSSGSVASDADAAAAGAASSSIAMNQTAAATAGAQEQKKARPVTPVFTAASTPAEAPATMGGAIAGNGQGAADQEVDKLKSEIPRILATFEVRVEGDRIRLIDSDGSTYTGRITQGQPLQQAAAPNGQFLPTQAGVAGQTQQFKSVGVAAAISNSAANTDADATVMKFKRSEQQQQQQVQQKGFSFRVSGASVSLGKTVVIEGSYFAGVPLEQTKYLAKSKDDLSVAPAQIQGQAQVGSEPKIDINAVSVVGK